MEENNSVLCAVDWQNDEKSPFIIINSYRVFSSTITI